MKKPLGLVYHAGKLMNWGIGVVSNGFVFLSGLEGRDPETDIPPPDLKAQTFLIFEKAKERLEKAGTSIENVVKMVVYLVRREDIIPFKEYRDEWLLKNAPSLVTERSYAGTLLLISGLDLPEMLVEVDMVAVLPGGQQ